ncbi:TraE/TraK family type IV conjugative transfer system protein [Acerihabitans sp. TG2]|uniref:TraE/TraK family type IV conjugative transfer system protein n=1 Tax=Acerihabitans sp. TG2 TaxID=3096008 RepID=UPI002B233881|nr:TraE/TraK family type IV conjugative transfer system protein [Acerihabitans sp. TG2]MEA9392686.1 TraE/TraK family type IV conjugative transfer system protein [Acerihabitans sp. TG2]
MRYQVKETRNRVTVRTIVALSSLLAMSIAGNCITGSLAWHFASTQKTITTPMIFDRSFTSDAAQGDASLNSMLVRSLVNLRLSVTPETVDNQHAALLRWVPPEYRPDLKKTLSAEADYIKKNGVSTVYRIDDETIDTKTGDTIVSGTLSASTSNGSLKLAMPDVTKAYRLSVKYVDGIIRLTAFPEVQPLQPSHQQHQG